MHLWIQRGRRAKDKNKLKFIYLPVSSQLVGSLNLNSVPKSFSPVSGITQKQNPVDAKIIKKQKYDKNYNLCK